MPYYDSDMMSDMTIGELIAELETLDPDMRAVLYHPIEETYMTQFGFFKHGTEEYTRRDESHLNLTNNDEVITVR